MADKRILLTVLPSVESLGDLNKFLSKVNERYSFEAFMKRLKNYDGFAGNYSVEENCAVERLSEMSGKCFCRKSRHNPQFLNMDGRLVLPDSWAEFLGITCLTDKCEESSAYVNLRFAGQLDEVRAQIHKVQRSFGGMSYYLSGVELKTEPEKISLRASA